MSKPLTLRLHIGDQTKEVNLPGFAEITLGAYIELVKAPKDELEHETVARILRIDTLDALAMKAHEATGALRWYYGALEHGAKEWGLYGEVVEELGEDGLTKPGVLDAVTRRGGVPDFIEVDGERYIVPKDIEMGTRYGQWVDLEASLDEMEGEGHDAEAFPRILAALCTKEGEVYKDVDGIARRKVFERCRMVDAYRVVAFFFSSSVEFASRMLRCSPNFLGYRRPQEPPVLTFTPRSGASGTS